MLKILPLLAFISVSVCAQAEPSVFLIDTEGNGPTKEKSITDPVTLLGLVDKDKIESRLKEWIIERQDLLKYPSSHLLTFKKEDLELSTFFKSKDRITYRFKEIHPWSSKTSLTYQNREISLTFDPSGQLLYIYSSLMNFEDLTPPDLDPKEIIIDALHSPILQGHIHDYLNNSFLESDLLNYLITQVSAVEPIEIESSWNSRTKKFYIDIRGLKIGGAQLPLNARLQVLGSGKWELDDFSSLASNLTPDVFIYDATYNPLAPMVGKGTLVLKNGTDARSLGDKVWNKIPKNAFAADKIIRSSLDFYSKEFGIDSWDTKGAAVSASINIAKLSLTDMFGMRQNAAWLGAPFNQFVFGSGGKNLNNLEKATDVIAHEFTHAVMSSAVNLVRESQTGALAEHFADAFGEAIQMSLGQVKKGQEFLIGESVVTEVEAKRQIALGIKQPALRNMADPSQTAEINPVTRTSGQPSKMSDISKDFEGCLPNDGNDRCGMHYLEGIPNKVFVQLVTRLGLKKVLPLYFNVMTTRINNVANFGDYARALLSECKFSGLPAEDCAVVEISLLDSEIIKK